MFFPVGPKSLSEQVVDAAVEQPGGLERYVLDALLAQDLHGRSQFKSARRCLLQSGCSDASSAWRAASTSCSQSTGILRRLPWVVLLVVRKEPRPEILRSTCIVDLLIEPTLIACIVDD